MSCNTVFRASAPASRLNTQKDQTVCRSASIPLVAKASSSTQSQKFSLPKTTFSGNTLALNSNTQITCSQRTSLKIDCGESRIGKKPVEIPAGVTYKLDGQTLSCKGKLGEMEHTFPSNMIITEEDGKIKFTKVDDSKQSRQLHGLCRSLAFNMINGVETGWEKNLELVGVGYRCSMQGKDVQLNLGFSHPVVMTPPEGVTVTVDGNTKLKVVGYDKAVVGNFAATIRRLRPPEPYKGKGVMYAGEKILRKEGKSGKK